jgi:phosphopantothenoylcysteine synthetase/decarboxylase
VGRPDIGFDADDNEVLLLARDGARELVSRRSKREVADKIWDAYLSLGPSVAARPPRSPSLPAAE